MSFLTSIKKKTTSARFWRNVFIQLIILAVIYTGLQFWQTRNAISGVAPAINGSLLEGSQVALSDYRGEPVLIHFWASWCPICGFTHPSIDSLAEDYRVLTFASMSGDEEAVSEYVREQGISAPVIVDEQGDWARLYGVKGFPSSFIVGPDGKISDIEIGYSSYWGLRIRMFIAGFGA